MKKQEEIRKLGNRIPRWLRGLRAKMLLSQYTGHLGTEEETCPACAGQGMLGATPLRRCPVCRGFGEVPPPLARWFEDELARLRLAGERRERAAQDRRRRPSLSAPARLGEQVYRVCLPETSQVICTDTIGE